MTNDFPQINTEVGRRPFKVLTPKERSGAMVIARYRNRTYRVARPRLESLDEPGELVWKAVLVGVACAALAFAFFLLSQRHWFERSGQDLGPLADSVQRMRFGNSATAASAPAENSADAKMITGNPAVAFVPPPQDPNMTVTEFTLPITAEFQSVGDVDLRLSGVNPSTQTYDITVRTAQREFYQQDVKAAEKLPLSRNERDGSMLVVSAISQNGVHGYVSEARHRGHRRHRRRS